MLVKVPVAKSTADAVDMIAKRVVPYRVVDSIKRIITIKDATELYNAFVEKYPRPANRAPRKDIASYINLTPETLSRVKNRGKNGKS